MKSLSVKPNLGTNTLNSVKMDIQSVINVIEYLNISNFVNKQRRMINTSEAGTINLYKARLLYLGAGEPPLKSLLIKDDMLEKGIFGPPRLILTYLPSIYLFEKTENTYIQLGTTSKDPAIRLNGLLGPWLAPENNYNSTAEFLKENDFVASDLRRMEKMCYEELVTTFQELIKRDIETQYREKLERYMIKVTHFLKIMDGGIYVEQCYALVLTIVFFI